MGGPFFVPIGSRLGSALASSCGREATREKNAAASLDSIAVLSPLLAVVPLLIPVAPVMSFAPLLALAPRLTHFPQPPAGALVARLAGAAKPMHVFVAVRQS